MAAYILETMHDIPFDDRVTEIKKIQGGWIKDFVKNSVHAVIPKKLMKHLRTLQVS